MATQVQWRGGSTAEHATFTGAAREVTVDTQKKTLVVHDGSTAGGVPLLRENQSNLPTSAPTTGIYNASGSLAISTGGSGRLFVDANGNIAVGTSATSNFGATARSFDINSAGGIANLYVKTGTVNGGLQADASNGYMQVWTASNHPIAFNIAFSEKMRLDTSGRLGVGTSSPSGPIHVTASSNGFISHTFSNTNNGSSAVNRIQIGNDASDGASQIVVYGSQHSTLPNTLDITNAVNAPIRLLTNNAERVRITGAGNVGIGTTTVDDILHLKKAGDLYLRVENSSTNVIAYFGQNSSGTYIGNGATGSDIRFLPAGTERARLTTSGQLLVGTSSAYTEPYLTGAGYGGTFVVARNAFDGVAQFSNWASSSVEPSQIFISRCRSGTIGTHTGGALGINEGIGALVFNGSDGGAFRTGAVIQASIDGAVSSGDLPTRLVFSTTADGASSPTERMRITSTGQLRLAGAGITFNGDTAAANELDDYEEGTHTATLTPSSSGTITLNSSYQTLAYTKIGRLVSVRGTLIASSSSSPVGYVSVSLPFAAANVSGIGYAGGSVFVDNSTGVNVNQYVVSVNGANARIYLGDATGLQSDSAQAIGSGGQIYLEINYHI